MRGFERPPSRPINYIIFIGESIAGSITHSIYQKNNDTEENQRRYRAGS